VTRYVLHRPLILSDEFGGYSLVIIAFLGFAYTWKERGHIRITFAVSRLPAGVASWLRIATRAAGLAYVLLATRVSYDFIGDAFRRNIRSNSWLMTPLKWPEMVIPVGFTLLALVMVFDIIVGINQARRGVHLEELEEEKAEEGSV
ncbi:MAG: TRAP transporter small permease, partial [Chloroflexota bacterium]|nr:TRAP transporter small permease [Chloroflexota bacterium]